MAAWAMSVAMLFVNCVSAQEKPNFSGEWTVTTPDGEATGFCGQQCTITQDATSLTVTKRGSQQKWTFKLDGSETTIAAPRSSRGLVFRAMWDGSTLRIVSPLVPTAPAGASIVFSMNAGQMDVETSIPDRAHHSKHTYKKN
jgi:hypothetical protein